MTIPSTPSTLSYLRDNVRDLLNEFDAADGLASYYALHHDDNRTQLFMHRGVDDQVDGLLARCQTGFDLFRPLITMRVRGSGAVQGLIEEGLVVGRPYMAILPAFLVERIAPFLTLTDVVRTRVLRLDPGKFRPEMNALVVRTTDQNDQPRAEIRNEDRVLAVAGVNWRSPIFAEVYVNVVEPERGRGMGRAVLHALAGDLLKLKVTPLYNVDEQNTISAQLAERVGFVDTGAREVVANAIRVDKDQG